jgi:hypothetical protein
LACKKTLEKLLGHEQVLSLLALLAQQYKYSCCAPEQLLGMQEDGERAERGGGASHALGGGGASVAAAAAAAAAATSLSQAFALTHAHASHALGGGGFGAGPLGAGGPSVLAGLAGGPGVFGLAAAAHQHPHPAHPHPHPHTQLPSTLNRQLQSAGARSAYLLYWRKSANTDWAGAQRSCTAATPRKRSTR